MIDPNSRHAASEIAVLVTPDGARIPYLRRRFIAAPTAFATLGEHLVADGDRLDAIAARHLDDPDGFWRICDANVALDPDELLVLGRRLRLTLPQGVPGPR